jgi:hypothetical protein
VLEVFHRLAKHFGAGADDLFEILLVIVAVLQGLAMIERALDGVDQGLALEGLEEIVVGAAATLMSWMAVTMTTGSWGCWP